MALAGTTASPPASWAAPSSRARSWSRGGSPSALVKSSDGQCRRLYSAGSPQRLVEVFGEAKVVRGRATVKLDADFDALVAGKGYQVVLTEYGNLGGVYVARRSEHSFQIRCRKRRGRGRVGYRVVAGLA